MSGQRNGLLQNNGNFLDDNLLDDNLSDEQLAADVAAIDAAHQKKEESIVDDVAAAIEAACKLEREIAEESKRHRGHKELTRARITAASDPAADEDEDANFAIALVNSVLSGEVAKKQGKELAAVSSTLSGVNHTSVKSLPRPAPAPDSRPKPTQCSMPPSPVFGAMSSLANPKLPPPTREVIRPAQRSMLPSPVFGPM